MTTSPEPNLSSPVEQRDRLAERIERAVYAALGCTDTSKFQSAAAQITEFVMAELSCLRSPPPPTEEAAIVFWYRNYKGKEGYRRVRPISIRYGSSEWHPEKQWLMLADDLVNNKRREFAMRDISGVVGVPILALLPKAPSVNEEMLAALRCVREGLELRGLLDGWTHDPEFVQRIDAAIANAEAAKATATTEER